MSVTSVLEIFNGRQASHDIANVRKYKRVFLVTCSSLLDGPFQVGSGLTGIPGLFNYYTDLAGGIDYGAIVQNYEVQQNDDPFTWTVTVQYSSALEPRGSPRGDGRSGRSGKAEQAQKGQEDQNPLNRPVVIKYSPSKFQRPVRAAYAVNGVATVDGNGNPKGALKNSAGELYTPRPQIDDSRVVVTIDRNEAVFSAGAANLYQDTVNKLTFAGESPQTWKLNISAQSAFENNLFYWQVTYTLEFRREGWDTVLEDAGYNVLDSNNKLTPARNPSNGAVLTGIAMLDGSGHLLSPPTATPILNDYQVYYAKDWTSLNLPQSF